MSLMEVNMKKEKMVIIDYNRYVNPEIILGTLIYKEIEYLNDWDEHDHGTDVYTCIGNNGKIYKGTSITSGCGYDYVIMPVSEYLKRMKRRIEMLKNEKKILLEEVGNLEKDIAETQKELELCEAKFCPKERKIKKVKR